ncbi:hypothetical protein DNTS_004220, partial [Danionella cerebrum]
MKGSSGGEETDVFFSSGETARLPCNNALSGCGSTTWYYDRDSGSGVELVNSGKIKDGEKHGRLRLGSDCSLNIADAIKEDFGIYSCHQYVNGEEYGADSVVYLHFLDVSSSQTEIRPGDSVTL